MPVPFLPAVDPVHAQCQAANPEISVWVAASAGSGKTKVLVDRVLHLLLQGVRPERILCLTFTRAAAAEMANRINQRLLQWTTLPESVLAEELMHLHGYPADAATKVQARRLFAGVLDVGLRIETLHAFCHALLRRFPLEAGVAPHFQVMDERDAVEAIAIARDQMLLNIPAEMDPMYTAALHTITTLVHETHFPELMDELAMGRSRLQRLLERWNGVDGVATAIHARLAVPDGETPLGVLAAACAEEAYDASALLIAAVGLQAGSKTDIEQGNMLAAWLTKRAVYRIETFDDYLRLFFTSEGSMRKTLITQQAAGIVPTAANALATEAERLTLIQSRRKAAAVVEATKALVRLGAAFLAEYRRYKEGRALLDYDDLILSAHRLLKSKGQAAWVLSKLDGGLDHLLIDEAQDISAEQWAIIEIITQEFFASLGSQGDSCQETIARTVFAVGDSKQSIYSFQGAVPDHFESMRALLRDKVTAARQTWADVSLNVSFRSTLAVLQAIDAVFTRDPTRDGVILAGETIHHVPFRARQAGLVEVWPLVVETVPLKPVAPWESSIGYVQGKTPVTRLAQLVAYYISNLVNGRNWLDSRQRPVQAGDIMVLVRRRSGFVEDLVRFLKSLSVPVAGVDRMILGEQIAVMDLTALGNVLLLPEDDLTLAAVLKSPLIGLNEDELFALAYRRGSRSLWYALQDHARAATPFGHAHDWLAGLLAEVDYRRPHELYARVLGPLNGRRRLVARLGSDAEDAIDEFLALTLHYEAGHVPSLQGFLQWLKTAQVEVKRDLEQGGTEAVRILTVHGAKGLQAPIIFLPDTVQVPTRIPRLLWEDGADGLLFWPPSRALEAPVCTTLRNTIATAYDHEHHRLLYVAMTRAEDRLYVCGCQTRQTTGSADCWYNLIRTALAPISRTETDPILATSGLVPSAMVLCLTNVQNQVIHSGIGEVPPKPVRQSPPIWAMTKPPPEPAPLRPLIPSQPEGEEPQVHSPLGYDEKMSYFHRGRLVHWLLQSLPALPVEERHAAARCYLDHAASNLAPAARAVIAAEVLAVFAHPVTAALFGPGSQAEVPVIGVVGTYVVSGQLDRLVVSGDSVIIADYKTNRLPPQRAEEVALVYLRQMAAYRTVLAAIYPSCRVDCVLVWTDGPHVMPLPGVLLDLFFPDNGLRTYTHQTR